MAGELEYSKTAGSNVAVNGIPIQGSSSIQYGNDAIQQLMADQASALTRHVVKVAGTYTALSADYNQLWRATGAVTINLTAAATLTDGWALWVKADGGAITIDPNGAELINGASTLTIQDGSSAYIKCIGTAFTAITIASSTPVTPGQIFGLTLSNNVSDATNDIDIAIGSAASDDTLPVLLTLAAGLTKRLDAAWTVGTNQGGLDTGSIANTTYHVWLIRRPDTGVVDALLSASATSPTMPANYTQKRRIGAIRRVSGTIIPFLQRGDDFYTAPVQDVTNGSAFAQASLQVSVPIGIVVQPRLIVELSQNAVGSYIYSLAPSSMPSSNVSTLRTTLAGHFGRAYVIGPHTTTSGVILHELVSTGGSLFAATINCAGWIDTRGRFA